MRLWGLSLGSLKASYAIDYLVLTRASDANLEVSCALAPTKRGAREVPKFRPDYIRARVYLIYIQKWKHNMIDFREVSNGGASKRSERRESSVRKRGYFISRFPVKSLYL